MELFNLFIIEIKREILLFANSDWVFYIMMLCLFHLLFDFIRFKAWRKF